MPLYVLIGHDVPDSTTLRQQHRPAHFARLTKLHEQGRLLVAGPTPSAHNTKAATMTGSVIIAEFQDDAAVQAWVSEEPFLINGIYSHVDIKPFIQTLPAPSH